MNLYRIRLKGFFHRFFYLVADSYKLYYSRSYDLEFYDFFNFGEFVGRVCKNNVASIDSVFIPVSEVF